MNRPQTSKPRGICQYYTTPRGCFAGSKCKFLHGPEQTLTPYDQSKPCKFFAAGFCRRGDECWFRHVIPGATNPSRGEDDGSEDVCNVCLEKPVTYGLLTGCGHVFCIACIRQWRNANDKTSDMSAVVKKCPLCRATSSYVVPSSVAYPHNHPGKLEAIEKYKASMARVPCIHFQESPSSNRICPFGKDCFYAHTNPDGSPYLFPHGVDHYIGKYRASLRNAQRSRLVEAEDAYSPADLLNSLFNGANLDDISATIETLRANLPAMLVDMGMDLGDESASEGDGGGDGAHYTDVGGGVAGGHGGHANAEVLARLAEAMLESLNVLRDTGHSPNSGLQPHPNDAEDDNDLPPLEPVIPTSSASSNPEISPPMPIHDNIESAEGRTSSRFSTSINSPRIYIEVDDEDEEDEEDSEDDDAGFTEGEASFDRRGLEDWLAVMALGPATAPLCDVQASPTPGGTTALSFPVLDAAGPSTSATHILTPTAPAFPSTEPAPSGQPEHNVEPPFVTDGRGRVVWSSTAARSSGRGARDRESTSATPTVVGPGVGLSENAVAPSRVEAGSGRGSKPRRVVAVRESVSEAASTVEPAVPAFTTDGRGRVIWTGSAAPASPSVEAANDAVEREVGGESLAEDEDLARSLIGGV